MVTFFLINPNREVSAISILVSMNGMKYRRSIRESVQVKLWNNNKKQVKVTKEFITSNDINDRIQRWKVAALNTISYFKERFNPPTKEEFFYHLDQEFYRDDIDEKKVALFSDFLRVYIDRYKNVRSESTVKKYYTTLSKIEQYQKEKQKRLIFADIDINFYNDFKSWMFRQNYSDNYFGCIIKVVKQVYKEARYVDKLHDFDEINHKDFIITKRDSDSIYLTNDELLRIHRLKFSKELVREHFPGLNDRRVQQKIDSLSLVRDRFLIGAYTGLRVSDFGRLADINFGEYIRIRTTKTGTDVVIPTHPVIKEIFKRGFDPMLIVSDQKINEHIKEIAKMAGITEPVLINRFKGGTNEQVTAPKYSLVATHTARRSFATNAYKAGVPTIAIMKITGHRKESTFLKYIKVSAQENAEMLKNHPFFKNAVPNAEPNSSDEL